MNFINEDYEQRQYKFMTTFIQTIALAILIAIIILIVKWQVDDDIKKMQKRLDDARKEINKKAKVMNKEITEDILLKAGFNKVTEDIINRVIYARDNITMIHYIHAKPHVRNWECRLVANNGFASADILTIDHFNKLMDLMDVNFRLKEE